MQTISLSLDLVNKILGYLGTRPYQEVYALVNAINTEGLPQIQAPAETTAETPDEAPVDSSTVTVTTPTDASTVTTDVSPANTTPSYN